MYGDIYIPEECYVCDANFSSYVELLIGIRAKGRETARAHTHAPSPPLSARLKKSGKIGRRRESRAREIETRINPGATPL